MLSLAVRFVATKGSKTSTGSILILCRVKPGVSANREGVSGISDLGVEVCVAARAKEGEADRAVMAIIAEAGRRQEICRQYIPNKHEALKVPQSDVEIIKGLKSREKTVMVGNIKMSGSPEEHVEKIKATLHERAGT
ncbi:hypothetical protein PMIN06_009421 [Paraphaeosphaeria minitans]|uniref:UPF0235 protein-like protein n=1 Tax=Paraphaeosphaeria minitans TaxID=565426 RepID=A0A9P6KNN9_9PLEO|nr:UPF0235 protein-like protein [Paraphaeosphaeria minitans]